MNTKIKKEIDKIEMAEKSSLVKNDHRYRPQHLTDPEVKIHSDRGLHIFVLITVTATGVLTIAMIFQALFGEPQVKPHGAVSTIFPECSKIALRVLQDGGSAVDSAISAAFCLTVVAPYAAGIGGGGLMIVHKQSKDMYTYVFDFLEVSPDNYIHVDQSEISQVGIPGFLKGMLTAHEQFGRLSLDQLLTPVIEFAGKGFPMSRILYTHIIKAKLEIDSVLFEDFVKNDKLIPVGGTIIPSKTIQLLKNIMQSGLSSFYFGNMGTEFLDKIQEMGSNITYQDLTSYKAIRRDPISITYKDRRILVPPSPSTGPLLALGIKTLNNLKDVGMKTVSQISLIIQVLFHINEKMVKIGDPKVGIDYSDIEANIYSNKTVNELLKKLDKTITKFNRTDVRDNQVPVAATIVDDDDMFVSFQLSLGDSFGSKLITKDGIILNNALKRFSTGNNAASGSVRPRTYVFPVAVIPEKGLCGERFAAATRHEAKYLELFAATIGEGTSLKNGVSNIFIDIQPESGKVIINGDNQEYINIKELIQKLQIIGYDVHSATSISYTEIVSKYVDDINAVICFPCISKSAIQY